MNEAERGQFPFGRRNVERPMRRAAARCEALVVGVYPSAFHIAWAPPPGRDPRPADARRRPYISSLAVDVEPTVFWNGDDPSPADELVRWKRAVGFEPEIHGSATVGNNGPSGVGLLTRILTPLGIDPSSVAFTDAVPWFFVKHGPKSQGDAIAARFNPIARQCGLPEGRLPVRPTAKQLVNHAATEPRRQGLRAEIISAGAPLVITLGQEALDAIRAVADRTTGTQQRLAPDGAYGRRGELSVEDNVVQLLPVVHPGFLRQTSNPSWVATLQAWESQPT